MKSIKLVMVSMMLISISFFACAQKSEQKEVKIKAAVDCNGCKSKLENSLNYEKGVKFVDASVADKTVTIKYDPTKTNEATLLAATQKVGYGGEIVQQPVASTKKCCKADTTKTCTKGEQKKCCKKTETKCTPEQKKQCCKKK